MTALTQLILASLLFVGSHFVMSHPLRAPLVKALGEKGFLALYSVVSLGFFVWMVIAFRAATPQMVYWQVNSVLWSLSTFLMWVASILLLGSFAKNPALPDAAGSDLASRMPTGVFRITRHPMMWAFALWAVSHILVSPTPRSVVLCGALGVLALVGARLQDHKKEKLVDGWTEWESKTSFLPFGRGLVTPGTSWLLAGTVLWLAATWLHPALGGPTAGIWAYF